MSSAGTKVERVRGVAGPGNISPMLYVVFHWGGRKKGVRKVNEDEERENKDGKKKYSEKK